MVERNVCFSRSKTVIIQYFNIGTAVMTYAACYSHSFCSMSLFRMYSDGVYFIKETRKRITNTVPCSLTESKASNSNA